MKFVELKKNIIAGKKYSVYNLCGDDGFLIDSSKKIFFKYLINNNELSKVVLSCENLQANRLETILNTSSFLMGERVVLLTELNIQKNKDIINVCLKYAKNSDALTTLVIVSNEPILDSKKDAKILLELKNFCFVDCNRLDKNMMNAWINSTLREQNATMSFDAIDTLIDYSNGYLSKISMEIQKLCAYANSRQITKDDVMLLVSKDLEYGVFELTECLGKGDAQRTLQIYDSLMSETKTALSVLSMIQNYFRRMFYCAVTPKTNIQIANLLGVKEWAVVKAKQSATLFTKATLKNILELCGELDFLVRTSKMPYKMATDYLIFYILTNNKNS